MAARKVPAENLQFMSIEQVAEKLAFHPKTVAKLIKSGDLDSVKLGKRRLISVTQLKRFIEANMTEGSLE